MPNTASEPRRRLSHDQGATAAPFQPCECLSARYDTCAPYGGSEASDRAVHHAMRVGDDDLIEQLVIRHATGAHTRGRYVTVRRWLDQMPSNRVPRNPAMCLVAALTAEGYAGVAALR